MKYDFDLDMVYNNSLSIIAKQINKNSTVLEFGPANGRLTKYMKEELGCQVYLVEIDEDAGKDALRYAQDLLVDDIENFRWLSRYADIRFDYIIFADVLEHLYNPKCVLQKAKLLLKETGSVLLSVPNVGHNSLIINLINNKFEYTDIGLLDSTHIHFFTKNSLDKMVSEAGFCPAKCMATYNEVGENEIDNWYTDVNGIDESFWKTREYGCVYQYVYELKTGEEYISERVNNIVKFFPTYFITFKFEDENGMVNDRYIRYKLGDTKEAKKFSIQLPSGIRGVKIDLVNTNCIVENIMACLVQDGKKEDVSYATANLDALEGGQYYFFGEKPEIYYCISDASKSQQFEFSLKYITLSRKEMNLIYDSMIKVKSQYLQGKNGGNI